MRTHGLATGLDLMSSREGMRHYLAIDGTHRFSFLGSRVAMITLRLQRGCGWVQPAASHKAKVHAVLGSGCEFADGHLLLRMR